MIIGHYGVSFALKVWHPHLPLWYYVVAAELMDLLHSSFVILGVEKAAVVPDSTALVPMELVFYPYTHSLLAALLWSLAVFLLFRLTPLGGVAADRAKAGALMAAGVFSHFVLDLVTHRPDLPLLGEDTKVGLGLWNHLVAALAVENLFLWGGLLYYMRHTRAQGFAGRYGLVVLCVVSTAFLFTLPLEMVPGDVEATEAYALAWYAVIGVWTWWADRDRAPTRSVGATARS